MRHLARRVTPAITPAIVVLTTTFIGTSAFAQPGSVQAAGSQATPLPLSGRTGQGSVVVTEAPVPAATTGLNTLNPIIQAQGPYLGSVRGRTPFSGTLGLRETIQRGLEFNLGTIDITQLVAQARSQRTVARSALLPHVVADLTATREEVNLAAQGLGSVHVAVPGFQFPAVVGPFNFVDLRARLSQSIVDLPAWNNYRASQETARATVLSADDARELVVLGVGGAYLQVIASKAKVDSAQAQVETANVLFRQASDRRAVGVVAQLDVNRAQVQVLVGQQRVLSLQNDLAKQKINLARLIGLPPTDQYQLVDDVPFSAAPAISLEEAIHQALTTRADVKAAAVQVEAAERALRAARSERLPAVVVSADYGYVGATPAQAQVSFAVVGLVRVPIWEGGRTDGHIQEAEAAVAQRRAELDDLMSQVEGDVRKVYLDLQAAASQVSVAEQNLTVTRQNLDLTRQRFDAGVTDNVELVQAQESLSTADLDRISSLFAFNVAKLNLARSVGRASQGLNDFLTLPPPK